jgi:hypothetical protein
MLLPLVVIGIRGAKAADTWTTVFDLKLQVGTKESVATALPTFMLGGYLGLPKEFREWKCIAGSVMEHRIGITTSYLECSTGNSTTTTQVSCQTGKADNNVSVVTLKNKKGLVALLTLSCQSFVSNPQPIESKDSSGR